MITSRWRELEVECNWKSFLEAFNEYYHLPNVLLDSISNVYLRTDELDQFTGHYASQFGLTIDTGGLLVET